MEWELGIYPNMLHLKNHLWHWSKMKQKSFTKNTNNFMAFAEPVPYYIQDISTFVWSVLKNVLCAFFSDNPHCMQILFIKQ